MEKPEFINCKTESHSDTEEPHTYEPNKMINSFQIYPEPNIKEDISRPIKEELLSEEIQIKSESDVGAVNIEQDFTAMIVPKFEEEQILTQPSEGSGKDVNKEVKDESNDVTGSPENEAKSVEEPANSQQNAERGLHILHIKEHSSCDLRGNTFANTSNLKNHGKVHSKDRPLLCDLCGFSFKRKCALVMHMKVHSNDLPLYFCNVCNRSFSCKSGLQLHKPFCSEDSESCCCGIPCTHKNPKSHLRFGCTICGKNFPYKQSLKRHMLLHSDRPYTCNDCGKEFDYRPDLLNHLFLHDNYRKYTCDICGKRYGKISHWRRHKLSHLEGKSFTCNECDKKFRSRKEMINHLVMHSTAKPFNCDICGFTTKRRVELYLHMVSHSDEKPFSCNICKRAFKRLTHLKKHVKCIHR